MTMTYENIIYEQLQGLGIITLNRPERRNAMDTKMVDELSLIVDEIEKNQDIRIAAITGGDRYFSAGADIKEKQRPPDYLKRLRNLFHKIEHSNKIFIASINGIALGGGCELALVCDIRIASDTAKIGLPELKIGALPSAGGTQRLPRLIGLAKAKELLFYGDPIDAQEAYRIGLVSKVVPTMRLMDETVEAAKTLMERAPLALSKIKSAVQISVNTDLESGLDYEAACATILSNTEDRIEGGRAFSEKRKPIFIGR